mmetsp:Transcript_19307/g.20927  ORF Transcript_19307/g.20927 Transcript_19307/m.20927 type:complete len:101 (-) Transcript_19307:71-373(-)|eukprot:gene12020-13128_t
MFTTLTRRSVKAFARRNMSGGASNAEEESKRWFKLSVAMIGLSTVLGLYNVAAHEHEHGRHDLPYMHIRTKPYPWECSDCNLFSGDCWKACKEGTTEEHH